MHPDTDRGGMTMDGMINYGGPYAEVFRKIGYCRANSDDAAFHAYLDKKLEEAEKGLVTPQNLLAEIDLNFARYQELQKNSQANVNNVEQTNYAPQTAPNVSYAEIKEAKKKRRFELEYKIGTGLLSVIGAVFVMVALIYFGKYFLSDIYQGVLLFACGALVVALSELILERRLSVLAHIITGVGFGVLYFATIFSYTKLNMYNIYIAFIVVFVIAVLNVFFAKGRKSQVMEVICSLGSASSVFVFSDTIKAEDFLIVSAVILIVNLLLFIAPYKEGYTPSKIIRLIVVASTALYFMRPFSKNLIDPVYLSGYAVLSILVMMVAYILNIREMAVKATSLSFIGIVIAQRLIHVFTRLSLDLDNFVFMGGLFAVCFISFLVLLKHKEKWSAYSIFMLSATLFFWFCDNIDVAILAILVILVISKITLAIKELNPVDAIITFACLFYALIKDSNPLSYAILGVGIIGAIMCTNLKLYHEYLLLVVCTIFALDVAEGFYLVPVVMAVVFILLLLFNLIPTMQVQGTKGYNVVSLIIEGLLVLYAPIQGLEGWENVVSLCLALVIGMAVILTCFTKKFLLDTKARYIILAVFLTYIAAFMDIGDLWVSVSLMAVAFLMIAVGCIANRFEIRIYGLILSLLVCVKVAFYDFDSKDEFSKMVVFFLVGIIAITISFVYLILEKHEQKQLREAEAAAACAPVTENVQNDIETTVNVDKENDIEKVEDTVNDSVSETNSDSAPTEGDSKCEED